MRLVDADALKEYIHNQDGRPFIGITIGEAFQMMVDEQPTIEERKTGKWIPFDIPWYQCSECGAVRENKSFMENFCPNCGADMRGGNHENP